MDSIEECVLSDKILVGISLDGRVSSELLSWAIGNAAHPNDTIIALHVLVGKGEKKINSDKTRFRQAKAFVISLLGEFTDICQTKQVNLEAKVRSSSSIGRGLTDEAALIEANFLLVGGSRNSSQRNSFEIMKYCFKYAPEGCSVIAVGKQGLPQNDTALESLTCEGNRSLSSTWNTKNIHVGKALSPLQKFFESNSKKEKRHSSCESICEKSSPKAVLDGPEGQNPAPEECLSPSRNKNRSRIHTNIRRRLSFVKLFFPFFRSPEELVGKETDVCSTYTEDQKPSWRCFSYEEISRATNNFHHDNMVGRGGYAEVFRGDLQNGQSVAVKRLAKGNTSEKKEREFLTELGIIGHVSHPNTAFLIGCCIENGLHLIFDFSPNGSLASALHGKNGKFLEWSVRYKIAIGIARGLHYLHRCCRRRIIHRDIKASNVLLGPDFEPQISDFGLAKWLPKQWTHHYIIPIEGTFGYLAPEYFMHGIVDEKTDVFAFGVLLLEIVTGRRPVDSSKPSLLLWAKPLIESGKIAELADPKLEGKYDMGQLQRLVLTASYCVRQTSIWRPSMSEVLQLLTDRDDLEVVQSWWMPESQIDEMDDWSLGTDFHHPH
ncbi:probable receptor-like serine/threonine-protein kinase At5g57670 [Elaeis guineensis]|uniref:Probable receptor-like serine/threonine-protein kinase At5g57670 n=1 Tax=Elaeis guineensis var. tenera TaxID=51953 RepID=A0A6I9RMV0_ELAGV|nr:probable receptor-like serine/threonine-protein kinase At5g57670 [Elaeis guineensis]